MEPITPESRNFIETIIDQDIANGLEKVKTRFPPEPNGYLHIGHAKAVFLNYGLAQQYDGSFYLRFDDTNPEKEEEDYVQSIIRDVSWLGAKWDGEPRYASDYFDFFYECALKLIDKGLAYVDDSSVEELRQMRGTLTEAGINSPYRERSIEENRELFIQMKEGAFPEGTRILRAKIDMTSPNMNMRDPALYRILHASHHNTGDDWHIYPMYDFAHPLEDAYEGITHSICTLEFEDHRPLYDWVIDNLYEDMNFPSRPRQYEFARLEIENTVTSKRRLKRLVDAGLVDGWDDPRLPTLSGLRRRGYTPQALKNFTEAIGVAKNNSTVEEANLAHFLRDDLNQRAPRRMVVLRPLKVTITNYPEDQIEWVKGITNPNDPEAGEYDIPFGRHIYIERDDFREEANKKYKRLKPGQDVRLRGAYIVTYEDHVTDPQTGEVLELMVSYDPDTKSGENTSGRKAKGTIHWVEASHAIDATAHLYNRLIDPEKVAAGVEEIEEQFNEDSLKVLEGVKAEYALRDVDPDATYQFMRKGYFHLDSRYSTSHKPVFNETIGLRDGFRA